ncbi:MAG TPA: serine/threonine-protein kinase [Solirubrobacteraceae bacterium]|nr:serine/threonine-protein kinase [Solirubrobacteraceae bacterium]
MSSWNFTEGDAIAPGRTSVRLLGGGRRYEAHLAWDDELHALVVVKVVRPHLVHDENALRGLGREALALRSLAHPMLVRGFDAVLDGERPHIVLEFLEGPRLSTLLRRYGATIEQLLPLAVNVCSALHYMHARGWVHLDVKPSNLVMGASPRLIDLSVARRLDELPTLSSPVGTDGYMAPEQRDLARVGELGPATDVWGLGATLREALAGRPVPPVVAALVDACLAPRPADRPSPAELAAELEPLAAALPRPRIGPMRPGGRRRMRELELR